jgi:FkbM family methyltransferase
VIGLARRFVRKRFPEVLNALHGYALQRRLQRRTLVETPHGFRFRGHEQMETSTFEPDEVAVIRRFATAGRVFVDAGANFGYYVCLARKQGAHVVAIEPLRENLDVLFGNLECNGWDDVEIFPVALGSVPGTAVLYGGGTAASLIPQWAGQSEAFKRTVPLATLDTLLAGRFADQEMFIKIDVEGFEHVVLGGARELLARTPAPSWLVEICLTENQPGGRCNIHFEEVFRTFWDAGYVAHTVDEHPRQVTRQDVARWVANRTRDFGYVNYLFTRN